MTSPIVLRSRFHPCARRLGFARSALRLTLGAALAWSSACDRDEASKSEASKTEASKADEPAPSEPSKAEPAPITEDQRALWRSTCAEVMAIAGEAPPPPPPPPPPSREEGPPSTKPSPAGTTTMPEIPPAPKRYAVVPRPYRSHLPDDLGLKKEGGTCDPAPFVALHEQHPKEESLYCAIAFALEECGQLEPAMAWTERRAEDFPKSVEARLAIAVRRFAPLYPDPMSGMPYNEALPALERIALIERVLADLDAALALDPNNRFAHVFASMALTQRALAWQQGASSETPEGMLHNVLARKDTMAAYGHTKAIGEAEGLEECTRESRAPCLPPPPLTEEEVRADAELEARLLGRE